MAEGTAANLFLVKNGVAITPPITDNILEGITRRTVLELLQRELKMTVFERSIDRSEIYLADEAFYCGTGIQVAAITRVDHRPIGPGRMGPTVSALRKLYFDTCNYTTHICGCSSNIESCAFRYLCAIGW